MSLTLGCHPSICQASGIITRSCFGLIYSHLAYDGTDFTISDKVPDKILDLVEHVSSLFKIKYGDLFQTVVLFHADHTKKIEVISSLREKLKKVANLQFYETARSIGSLLVKCSNLETTKPLIKELSMSLESLTVHLTSEDRIPFPNRGHKDIRRSPRISD